jgi:glycosyltransferase involved in cell wall biosynthesis
VTSPFFSVVIPTYNRGSLLRQALDSVFRQTYHDFEVLVVDDGSEEDIATAIGELQNRITLLRQPNAGPGAARNHGARTARGEYLALLDSDDLWFPWTLEVYAQAIGATGRPSFLAGRFVPFDSAAELGSMCFERPRWTMFDDYLASWRRGLYCGSCQAVIRRDIFLSSGGFTERRINAEDHDFTLRIGAERGFTYVEQPAMIGYRQHAAAMTVNLERTFQGIRYLLDQERNGRYPGGRGRQQERRRILTQHVRPVSLALLRQGNRAEAWELFSETFGWNLRQGRWRYLAAFPALSAARRSRKPA